MFVFNFKPYFFEYTDVFNLVHMYKKQYKFINLKYSSYSF